MNHTVRSIAQLTLVACLLFASQPRSTRAADAPQPDADGWITLFDGKTLTGWHKNPKKIGHGSGGNWTVEPGGVLAGEQDPPGSGNGGILLTDRKFGDFELSLEMKPNWGSDSGIFLRSTDQGECIQAMVDYYNGGSVGHFYGEATGAWGARTFSLQGDGENGKLTNLRTVRPQSAEEVGLVASCTPEEWLKAWKVGDWNQALIRVEGGRYPKVTTYINGLKVGELDLATFQSDKYDREKVADTLGDRGHIALQVHGGDSYPPGARCRYRNIRVRELNASPAAEGSPSSLPKATIDGTGPGWRALGEQDFVNVNGHDDTWTWDGGLAKCTGQPVGVIRSQKPFTNFELVAQWRHLRSGGNSGIFVWTSEQALAGLQPGKLPPGGIEVQVLDHGYTKQYEKSSGKKADWFTTNGDVFPVGTAKMKPFPPISPGGDRSFPRKNLSRGVGEWNHYYIRAINGEVRLWVNGEEVSGGTDCQPATGFLCLESEGAPVEFKDLRIRELP